MKIILITFLFTIVLPVILSIHDFSEYWLKNSKFEAYQSLSISIDPLDKDTWNMGTGTYEKVPWYAVETSSFVNCTNSFVRFVQPEVDTFGNITNKIWPKKLSGPMPCVSNFFAEFSPLVKGSIFSNAHSPNTCAEEGELCECGGRVRFGIPEQNLWSLPIIPNRVCFKDEYSPVPDCRLQQYLEPVNCDESNFFGAPKQKKGKRVCQCSDSNYPKPPERQTSNLNLQAYCQCSIPTDVATYNSDLFSAEDSSHIHVAICPLPIQMAALAGRDLDGADKHCNFGASENGCAAGWFNVALEDNVPLNKTETCRQLTFGVQNKLIVDDVHSELRVKEGGNDSYAKAVSNLFYSSCINEWLPPDETFNCSSKCKPSSEQCCPRECKSSNAQPCSPGFFCPKDLGCMVPCGDGAYCTDAEISTEEISISTAVEVNKTVCSIRLPNITCLLNNTGNGTANRNNNSSKNNNTLTNNMSLFMKSHNKTHRSNSVIHCSNTSTWLLQKPLVVTSFRDDTIAGGIFGHEQYDPDDDVGCGGSASNAFCPGGYVCERPWVILPCSEGHYCPVGVSEGTKCDLFSLCPQGTVRPMSYFLTIIFFSAIGILLLFIFFAKMVYSCSSRPQQQKNRTNLVSTTNQQTRNKALYKCDHIIDFTFKDLHLEIPECCSKKKVLLESVSGHLESGKITAIMGPSGAGKTTLLDVLAGRKTSGFIRRGKLLINGANEPISKFSKEIGYVPQEDTMYRSLTPRENLQYSAQLRLKASVTAKERNNLVNEVLIMLDIYDKADDRIGDVEEKGLSGGQLKRVNIGMELVAKPSVLFLDEPTSGLDSSTSLIVLEALQNIAHKGNVNVMAVVHQPRYEIFKQLDKLVLLCKGGRTAYVGKASEALGHFKQFYYHPVVDKALGQMMNPPDFFIDAIQKKLDRKWLVSWDSDFPDMGEKWLEKAVIGPNRRRYKQYNPRKTIGCIRQSCLFFFRSLKLQKNTYKLFFQDLMLYLIGGGVVGGMFFRKRGLPELNQVCMLAAMVTGFMAVQSSLRCFGNNRPVHWREASGGINRLAFFFGSILGDLPRMGAGVFAFLVPFTFLYQPMSSGLELFVIFSACTFAASGFGYIVSLLLPPQRAQLTGVVLALIMSMLSGLNPTLPQMDKMMPCNWMTYLYSLGFNRYAVEAMFISDCSHYTSVWSAQVQNTMNVFGFDLSHYVWCIKCMIWIGVGTRLISLWLILSNSVKQGRSDPCNFVCCCLSRNHKNGSDGTLIGHIIATIAVLAAGIYLMIPSSKFNVWTSDTHSCNLVVAGNASNNCYIENIMKLPGPGILLGTVLLLIVAILGSAHRHNVLSTRCSETCITLFALFIIIFAVFAFTVGLLQLTPGNSTTQCELMDSIVIAVVTVYFLGKTYYFATNQDDRRTHPVEGISGGFEEKSDFNYVAL